jgi:hypothetical protein
MALTPDFRRFLRDLALLLGLPGIALAFLFSWWRPWEQIPFETHPVSDPIFQARLALERRAREDGIRTAEWHGLHIEVPTQFVLTVKEPTLELLERVPPAGNTDQWSAQMAFLEVDSGAAARFKGAASNCDLAPGRCWVDQVGQRRLECQRSSGAPDPDIPWTPHLECQVPTLGVRVLINASYAQTDQLLDLFKTAVSSSK